MARCPDDNQVLSLVTGKISRLVALPLQSHIESCRRCQAVVAEAARSVSRRSQPGQQASSLRLTVGSVLDGRYELLRVLGQGGSGVVWAALDLRDGQPVALKTLRSATAEQAQRLLQREARLPQRVNHPAFVPIREVVMFQTDQPVLVMDLLDGRDLAAHLLDHPQLSLADALAILEPVASALAALHAQKIAHRDLKPANIFLERTEQGPARIRILDLGMARSFDLERATVSSERITSKGTILGTPRYMAPEQLDGRNEIDTRADIWALGAIGFRLLSGQDHTSASTPTEVVRALYCESIPQLAQLAPELPAFLSQLIQSSLQLNAGDRPSSEHWVSELSRLRAAVRE